MILNEMGRGSVHSWVARDHNRPAMHKVIEIMTMLHQQKKKGREEGVPGNGDLSALRVSGKRMGRPVVVATAAVLLIMIARADAGEIEPRAYVNTPVGVNFLIAGYTFTDGGLATAASSPIKDAELRMQTGILAYARALDVCGNSGKFDVILPYSELSGSALVDGQTRERHVSGLNDPRFRFTVNFYGAPALPVADFATYQQDVLIGASIQVSAPVGQYDQDKLVNLGNNRWWAKPDIGISKAWGAFTLELSTGVTLFTDNDDYRGSRTL